MVLRRRASLGGAGGFGLQYWVSAIAYPLNIGGKPLYQLADVHPGHLRADHPGRRADRGARHGRAEQAAAAVSPGVQRARASPARQPDRFFLASRRTDPKFDRDRDASTSSRTLGAQGDQRGGAHEAPAARLAAGDRVGAGAADARLPPGHARPAQVPRPARSSTFFADGSSAAAAGRGHHRARHAADRRRASSPARTAATTVTELPVPGRPRRCWTRGEERFNIYCTPCHGRTGAGDGMVVQRGYRQPPSFHIDRLRTVDGRPLLRRHDQRLRRDAGLPGAGARRAIAGHRRLHPGAAIEPARHDSPTCRAAIRRSWRRPRRRARRPADRRQKAGH